MPSSSSFGSWLRGVRVLDFTAVLAGPHATRVLAQAGADVIKIEQVGQGDTTRALPSFYAGGRSGYFKQQNLGKRSVALDMGTEAGHAIVMDIARGADVVVENFRPGVVMRLGIDYESIRAIRPGIVYLSISGWGQTGPSYHLTGEVVSTTALSGLTGPDMEGNPPGTERCSFGDTNASIHAVAAIAAALVRSRRTGKGAYIDLAILEALLTTNALELPEIAFSGSHGANGREHHGHGGDHARVASGTFACRDGHVYVAAITPSAWEALATRLGLAHLGALGMAARRDVATDVYTAVASYCAARDVGEAVAELAALGVSAVPVRTVGEVVAAPETRAAGLVQDVEDAFEGAIPVPTGLFASRAFGLDSQRREPLIGEHTREVLRETLGYAPAAIDELLAAGVARETLPPGGDDGR